MTSYGNSTLPQLKLMERIKMSAANDTKHPRYAEFTLTEASSIPSISLILHRDPAKLRSHAVKHFSNMLEMTDWQKVKAIPHDKIQIQVDELRTLGCPYFEMLAENPPCRGKDNSTCAWFDTCGPHTELLETTYLEICRRVIGKGLAVPRAVVLSSSNNSTFVWILPNLPIVAKLVKQETVYNLMTCHRPQACSIASWSDIRNQVVRSAKNQSRYAPLWLTEGTWGQQAIETEQTTSRSRHQHLARPKKKRQPYRRGGSRNPRSYLDGLDD